MKKRMLITTIVMVLVVAIALTTSSLAWFTMSATVSISEVSFGAATYDGAQLSVAGLNRTGFGASASIGTGVTFDPSQGEPTVSNITLASSAPWNNVNYEEGTFQSASDVTTTAAGNQTANQKVALQNTTGAVFIGGFNIRNDGTGAADVTIDATLNVGAAWLVNPTGDSNTADDYYVYGDFTPTAGVSWDAGNNWYTSSINRGLTEAAFAMNQKDIALAGGLRVAVFTRTWTWAIDGGAYTNAGSATREGIYGFTNYKVVWGAAGWESSIAAGNTNNLYVAEPTAGIYSKNEILADSGKYVANGQAGINTYSVTALGTNSLPTLTKSLLGEAAGVRSGIEVVVVVWMDGWDDESVPAAGGGRVSLSYAISSSTAA